MPRPITIDEVASFPYTGVDGCDLSADGLRVAYTHRNQIHIAELETSKTYEPFSGSFPKWSPVQPDMLAFLKPESSGVWVKFPRWNRGTVGRGHGKCQFFPMVL